MARPKKEVPEGEIPQEPATERVIAPEPPPAPAYMPPAPRQMRVERQGISGAPSSRRFPQVRGGVCEFCGVLDRNVPSQFQYRLCPHYRGMSLRCSYCAENRDPDDVIYHANLNIQEHPTDASTLVIWCDSRECSDRHLERFKVSA